MQNTLTYSYISFVFDSFRKLFCSNRLMHDFHISVMQHNRQKKDICHGVHSLADISFSISRFSPRPEWLL